MQTLREISADYQEVLYQALNCDEIPEELFEKLKSLDAQFDQKIENMAYIAQELIANSNVINIEIDRLARRAERFQKNLKSIKDYMQFEMISAQKKKIETPLYTVKLRRSEVCEVDGEFIAEAKLENLSGLLRVVPEKVEPDKKAIKEFLNAGGNLKHARIVEKSNLNIT